MMQTDSPLNSKSFEDVARVMRQLADPTRLRLLTLLTRCDRGELNVTSLCELTQLPQPTVSHHLGLLRTAGLARNRRDGKQVFYSLEPKNVTSHGRSGLTFRAGEFEIHLQTSDSGSATSQPNREQGSISDRADSDRAPVAF